MKLFTSNFATSAKNEKAVSIARGNPAWFTGRKYITLAPEWYLVKGGFEPDEFKQHYYKTCLSKLNPEKVANALGDGAVMLCWEPVGKFCHRSLVAAWITEKTGIVVEEIVIIKHKPEFRDFTEPAAAKEEQLSLF